MASRLLIVLLALGFIFGSSPVAAITPQELQNLDDDAFYYDPLSNCSTSATSSTTPTALSSGSSVYILGDSITVRTTPYYTSDLQAKGIKVNIDGQVGRSLISPGTSSENPGVTDLTTGMQAIAADTTEIKQAGAIVVGLGTNGGDTPQTIDAAVAAIRKDNPTAPLYWIDTIVVDRPDYTSVIQQANQAIYSQASSDNYQVISWFKTVDPNGNPQQLTGAETDTNNYIDRSDGLNVHPTIPTGTTALANLVVGAITGGSSSSSSGNCCATTTLSGNGIVQQIYNYFVGKGLSSPEVSGILGNLYAESGLRLEIYQGTETEIPATSLTPAQLSANEGWGLPQWTPPSTMITPTLAANQDPDNLSVQVSFLDSVLNQQDPYFSGTYIQALKGTSTPQTAAYLFEHDYERPTSLSDASTREAYAEAFFLYATKGTALPPSIQVSSGSSGGGSSSSSTGCNSGTGSYQNPLRSVSDLVPLRIDQGVDYSANGPVYAIGDAKVVYESTSSGWPGGTFVEYQLTDGPASGDYIYVAENCTNIQVTVGESVTSSSVLCTMHNTDPWIETGWGSSSPPDAAAHNVYATAPDGTATAYGVNFSQLMQSIGAPPGDQTDSTGTNVIGTLPPNWPTW